MRNINSYFNKECFIKYIVEVNIYYQRHQKRTEIDVIRSQKWSIILGMLWWASHNPEIDQRIEEMKMTRCLEKCGKQQILKQKKSKWQKKKEKEKEKEGRKETRREET